MDVDTGQFKALTATAERVAGLEQRLADLETSIAEFRLEAIPWMVKLAYDHAREVITGVPRLSPPGRLARGICGRLRRTRHADDHRVPAGGDPMSDPASYRTAWEMSFPDVLNRYQVLENRDTMARSRAARPARGEPKDDRSLNLEDYPPLSAAEHLELLALGERIARHFRHPAQVHHAVLAGATWAQIAEATGGDVHQVRQAYQAWAEGQRQLRQQFADGTLGLGEDEYAAALKAAGIE